jgi:nucleoside-diphosphate-sugar epimerase
MRVLVLGPDGFVGRAVTVALARTDWAVPTPLRRISELAHALQSADSVVNCVMGRPDVISETARQLFTIAGTLQQRPAVVHLSSMTVYGSVRGRVDESSPLLADLGAYSRAQREADRLAAEYTQAIRLRPGCEYGPGCEHWTGMIARCLVSGRLGDLGAAGDGYCNLLFIDDLVAAILQALRRPELQGRAFNLAVAAPPTWNEYFIRFAKALGAVPVRRISQRRLKIETKILAPPLKVAQILLARSNLKASRLPPPLAPSLLAACRQEIRMDVSQAEAALGMRWTGLESGLERAAQWCGGAH